MRSHPDRLMSVMVIFWGSICLQGMPPVSRERLVDSRLRARELVSSLVVMVPAGITPKTNWCPTVAVGVGQLICVFVRGVRTWPEANSGGMGNETLVVKQPETVSSRIYRGNRRG